MIDLKCKCGSCEHNSNCNCFARHIKIEENTKCKTFQKSKDSTKAEYADEIAQPLVRPSVVVECDAKCLFNHSNKCIANGITVINEKGQVECSTFLPQ